MPFTSQKLIDMIGSDLKKWKLAGNVNLIKTGHTLNEPSLLFSIIEDNEIENQIVKLESGK